VLHKTIATKAQTITDRGEFTAIAAAYSIDRVGDQIVPGAFKGTIRRWRQSGKDIPLHWDHEGTPEAIIGGVNPSLMREMKDGLYVAGKIDLEDSELGREAWRSVKSNRLSLSFGYLATREEKSGDVNRLLEIDLFEVSVVAAPANADTRFLSFKNASTVEDGRDEEALEPKSAPQDPLVIEAWRAVLGLNEPSSQSKGPVDLDAWAYQRNHRHP
jgi:HK97 family phage prohead protease